MTAYEGYDSDPNSSLVAFVCGALVGAAAALLFAPMRGDEMRQSLGDAARQSRDRLRQYGETGREWANEKVQEASDAGRSAINRASEAVDSAVGRAQDAVKEGAGWAEDATDRARGAVGQGVENAPSSDTGVGPQTPDKVKRDKEQWS